MNSVELTCPTPQTREDTLDLMGVRTDNLEGEALAWAAGKAGDLDLFLEGPSGYLTNWRVFQRYAGQALVFTKHYSPPRGSVARCSLDRLTRPRGTRRPESGVR